MSALCTYTNFTYKPSKPKTSPRQVNGLWQLQLLCTNVGEQLRHQHSNICGAQPSKKVRVVVGEVDMLPPPLGNKEVLLPWNTLQLHVSYCPLALPPTIIPLLLKYIVEKVATISTKPIKFIVAHSQERRLTIEQFSPLLMLFEK